MWPVRSGHVTILEAAKRDTFCHSLGISSLVVQVQMTVVSGSAIYGDGIL